MPGRRLLRSPTVSSLGHGLRPSSSKDMHWVLVVLVSASQILYEAQVASFGCNSNVEVSKLQGIRSDAEAFQKLLTAQVAYGQCVTIPRGAVVEGSTADTQTSTLLINAKSDPPGYIVPLRDFKLKKADTTR